MPTDNHPSQLRPTSRRPLLRLAIAAVVGIVADRMSGNLLTERGLCLWWSIAIGGLLIGILLPGHGKGRLFNFCLLVAVVCLGGSWHHLRWNYYEHDHLARFATVVPQPVCLRAVALGRIKASPAPPANPMRAMPVGPLSEIEVRVTRLRDGREWRSASGTCKLRVNGQLQDVIAGDELLIFARMSRLAPALNPGEYNWSQVARGAGHHCQLFCRSPDCVKVTQQATQGTVNRWVHRVGERCERRLTRYVRPAQRDLALAILLGARERLTTEERATFLETGTIHLLVVSGLHVGLLAVTVWAIVCSGLLPRKTGLAVTVCFVVVYALIVGGRPPVIRSSVIVVLTLFSYLVGRPTSPVNLLSAAALVVLAINPSELFRSGTQLSFLCVAALAAYGGVMRRDTRVDPLTRLLHEAQPAYRKAWRWLVSSFMHTAAASLAVWLAVAPLVAYHFQIAAPISILITPLLWPLVAMALISGLALCFVGWLVPPLAWLLGQACSFSLASTESIVAAAREFNGSHFYLPGPPGWWVLVLYAGLLGAALVVWPRLRWRCLLCTSLLWIATGWVVSRINNTDEQLRCHFLAVGHGTCVVLELPGGKTMLYDCGSIGSPMKAAKTIASFLWSRGISHLDAVVLSHADVDHYNALPGLLERFRVDAVYVSPLMFEPLESDSLSVAPRLLQENLLAAEVSLREVCVDDRLPLDRDDVEFEILHPPPSGVEGHDNANSLLLAIRYAGYSILLPGDLESPGIEAVTAGRPRPCDILLAPHHGSIYSDPPGFAAWCTPNWVIVSGPRASPDQQLTTDSYQRYGAQVLYTADVGAVQFTLDKHGLTHTQFVTEAAPPPALQRSTHEPGRATGLSP